MTSTPASLLRYAERIFSRPAYIEALTPAKIQALARRHGVGFVGRAAAGFAKEEHEDEGEDDAGNHDGADAPGSHGLFLSCGGARTLRPAPLDRGNPGQPGALV